MNQPSDIYKGELPGDEPTDPINIWKAVLLAVVLIAGFAVTLILIWEGLSHGN